LRPARTLRSVDSAGYVGQTVALVAAPFTNVSRSALIVSASVVGMPCGKPLSGIRFLASRRLRVYTRFPPIEPCRSVVFLGGAQNNVLLVPARTERLHSSRAPSVFQTTPHRGGHFVQFPITAESALPRGNGQRLDPPYHGSKQPSRQVTLGQQQPIVTGVLHQSPPVFTSLCCKLVSDQFPIRRGSASRRHRFPRCTRSRSATAGPRSTGTGGSLAASSSPPACPSLIHYSEVPRLL
jgi:hypothetical protein